MTKSKAWNVALLVKNELTRTETKMYEGPTGNFSMYPLDDLQLLRARKLIKCYASFEIILVSYCNDQFTEHDLQSMTSDCTNW